MKKLEKIFILSISFILGVSGGLFGSYLFSDDKPDVPAVSRIEGQNLHQTNFNSLNKYNELPDFVSAAEKGTQAVVNIRTEYYAQNSDPLYILFFGNPSTPVEGSGSGVIISPKGYIVTNNHVVEKATNITVTLNDKREYKAKLIGTDPSTDLALLKIDEINLPTVIFGDSDELRVGEWVLAVGNPYSLTSTVTAGIVSAKARNISILKQKYAIESFIQTDAAVNPGNSGGALINIGGKLVGINAAIASPTGSYAGYSFAIPAGIVKKVVADLIEFGAVQRAYLGVKISGVNEEIAQTYDLSDRKGVYVNSIVEEGAADVAGISAGDIILSIDSMEVNSASELLEFLGKKRPGDVVKIKIRKADGDIVFFDVTLKNNEGGVKNTAVNSGNIYGATFENLSKQELRDYGLNYGVRVKNIMQGKFLSVGIKEGFIIEKINEKPVKSAVSAVETLDNLHGGVYIEGYYPALGQKSYYAFGLK